MAAAIATAQSLLILAVMLTWQRHSITVKSAHNINKTPTNIMIESLLWTPSDTRIRQSNMYQFMQQMNQKYGLNMVSYRQLHDWSIQQPAAFWEEMWQLGHVVAHHKGKTVLANGHTMLEAKWFPEAKLNYAANLLKYRDDQVALIFRGEDGQRLSLTYHALYQKVAALASGLQQQGIVAGDRIAGFMPNNIDTVIAMLATTSLGAIWSSCSPDFGINGVLDRFGQIKPKILFTTDGYLYNGKCFNSIERVASIADQLPSIQCIIVCPHTGIQGSQPTITDNLPNGVWLDDFIDTQAQVIEFAAMNFADPLFIMFSSGTTGKPKCIVHSIGGTLLQHNKEHILHTDISRDDVLFYYTTCGWMMWNWLVSALATGCTVVLYDGSPFKTPSILMDIAEQERISVFGTSAKYITALEKADVKPKQSHQLASLKTILSTGSPLLHESFDYVYRDIKQDVLLASISGGTDIVSCFLLGCPMLPVYRGQLQCAGLGLAVDIFDDHAQSIEQSKGELVCTRPFPCMPIGFWDDNDGQKYHNAYFAVFDNIWAHGDYGEITSQGGFVIHGRSDAVLNPNGVRIGTAEIYRQVETISEVLESVVVGQDWQQDVRVILFVKLKTDTRLSHALIEHIKQKIRTNTTTRHVPAKIIQVADIPRTISGKIVELAVRKIIHGQTVNNQDALANPEALDLYVDLPELAH